MVVKWLLPVLLAIGGAAALGFYFFLHHAAARSEPAKVHRVSLNWNKVARASGYRVYRRNYRDGDFVSVGKTEGTSFEDAAAMGQERYCYQVASADAQGQEGSRSKEFCVTVPYP